MRIVAYPGGMSDTKSPVYLDADLLARVEGLANAAGLQRDEYVEDALRQYLAGRDLVSLQREISTRTGLGFDDALDLIYAERNEARRERTNGGASGPER
jgi:predicted transcriptional regulator